jgi:glutathionylspermidine synthase
MERENENPRLNWQQRCNEAGFKFHSMDGAYWKETQSYAFTPEQIQKLTKATTELHEMCLKAVAHVIKRKRFEELAIKPWAAKGVIESWERRDTHLYGRMDLSWDGLQQIKLLEYNADTPTSLLEASVAQADWLNDTHPQEGQFNAIQAALVERWKLIAQNRPGLRKITLAGMLTSEEDSATLAYLGRTANMAGLETQLIDMRDVGHDGVNFVDAQDNPISCMFKLYPWEWMWEDAFGPQTLSTPITWIEPPWKAVLSNKGILPILWELFPGHPNLLPAFKTPEELPRGAPYVIKPLFSREGANIKMIEPGECAIATDGSYGKEGYIYQVAQRLPQFGEEFAVIGSWVVGDRAVGLGMREDSSLITRNSSSFVPHRVRRAR